MKLIQPKTAIIPVLLICLSVPLFFSHRPTQNQPEIKFFLESHNRNENTEVVRYFTKIFGDKIQFRPIYIFSKTNTPTDDLKNYFTFNDGNYYSSSGGRSEASQNIREICAFNLKKDLAQWWQFVTDFSKNCSIQNSDTCWATSAVKAGLNPNLITDCFNRQAQDLIESQLNITSAIKDLKTNTVLIENHTLITNFQVANFLSALCQNFVSPPSPCYQPLTTYEP